MSKKKVLKPYEALYPVPVVLVSCIGIDAKPNIITIAWAGVICSSPPTLSISIRPSRYSHKLIKESTDFVVNIPDEKYLVETDFCGIVSGRDTDKFKACNFTAVKASKVKSPLIAECPVNIECRLKGVISLGAHDMFIGEVVAVNADSGVLNSFGAVDYSRVSPVVYNQRQYWSLNKRIGEYGFSRKIKKI
ncbi:MAG: flavin reductase family protein [Candidatus Omnitrophica bacterium CG12_big_fil_rev_8_21_14_0_65_43_15]|uniref:Flavin reductase family protein n=1 Tax=Candidatus Taenaricola geysiri TaxID=1974752 RepID=A0A2J0LG50_9BACT|nr:MAG: flavin reductase [Candidatus Omnitrophica bacterium CG1_02_43_210]PIV12431.1 MAG: flavin reductase family protein [Candidatus Omnitrophica bacterium CG03_land_8_20_14_0_80_43_22]PIW66815.1 MAG: flavin reductase family protein [Candidatus Omnitrophica bacterium CG12_big_fil_rev_8_21_14_0_65_43_15]PIW80414.1 MAG: flavin reductase family protein [Candidatus Omnitrophica bacterium CG_4_8_14_3_um_filter_43_15]PIY84674.1 MAG: flavin reductase family protein [Candidatus Omnitrophica bacterium 